MSDRPGARQRVLAHNPLSWRNGRARLVALDDGEVLVGLASPATLLRLDAAGELLGGFDLEDGLSPGRGLALRRDPCGGVVYLRASVYEVPGVEMLVRPAVAVSRC